MPDLTYRPLSEDDFEAVHSYVSLWPVVRQLGAWPWPPDPAFTRSRCQPYTKDDGFVWAVCLDGRLVGTIGVTGGEIGYTFHPDVHGRGIGTLAAKAAIEKAFATQPDLQMIRAGTWIDNAPSHRLLLRLGFQHRQTRYLPSKARGLPVPCRSYKLWRKDWLLEQSG